MADTIFARIIAGEIPCHRVYEDEQVFAFLDINPLSPGHCLVIPKEPAETLDALSDEAAAAVGRALPRICRALVRATGVADFNVLQNNGAAAYQLVRHVHFHLIPKPGDGAGLGVVWRPGNLEHEQGAQLAAALRAELGQ